MTKKILYPKYFKRLLDLIFSILGTIILAPIMLLFGILLILDSGFPLFFYQLRPGLNLKLFKIIKFRTINSKNGINYSTNIQNFIRLLSIDEIPQLYNVIKGDMSLVGHRPLIAKYLPLYSKRQSSRHNVKPGMTGFAQIHGRNSNSWNRTFTLDIWYVNNLSFLIDLKIIFKTFFVIFDFKKNDFRKNKTNRFKNI